MCQVALSFINGQVAAQVSALLLCQVVSALLMHQVALSFNNVPSDSALLMAKWLSALLMRKWLSALLMCQMALSFIKAPSGAQFLYAHVQY